ncbi:hypothetical protein QVD17_11754 [Tagetes erecta]|uniref:Uncharacterized protein n=1 Tax=Tagetes erecta TaxID=13708 RepID=A0AAD8P165_TARER|nr:hypothetical protein QVD17_11754 [Tagetes erecta]
MLNLISMLPPFNYQVVLSSSTLRFVTPLKTSIGEPSILQSMMSIFGWIACTFENYKQLRNWLTFVSSKQTPLHINKVLHVSIGSLWVLHVLILRVLCFRCCLGVVVSDFASRLGHGLFLLLALGDCDLVLFVLVLCLSIKFTCFTKSYRN